MTLFWKIKHIDMTKLILLYFTLSCLLALSCSTAAKDPTSIVDDCGDGKTFSRKNAIDCVFNVVDTDHNERITPKEIDDAKSAYLKWWEKTLSWIIGAAKTDNVMKKCDANKDGFITHTDFPKTQDTCMPLLNKEGKKTGALCKFKSFCDRAADKMKKTVYWTRDNKKFCLYQIV